MHSISHVTVPALTLASPSEHAPDQRPVAFGAIADDLATEKQPPRSGWAWAEQQAADANAAAGAVEAARAAISAAVVAAARGGADALDDLPESTAQSADVQQRDPLSAGSPPVSAALALVRGLSAAGPVVQRVEQLCALCLQLQSELLQATPTRTRTRTRHGSPQDGQARGAAALSDQLRDLRLELEQRATAEQRLTAELKDARSLVSRLEAAVWRQERQRDEPATGERQVARARGRSGRRRTLETPTPAPATPSECSSNDTTQVRRGRHRSRRETHTVIPLAALSASPSPPRKQPNSWRSPGYPEWFQMHEQAQRQLPVSYEQGSSMQPQWHGDGGGSAAAWVLSPLARAITDGT